MFLCDYYVVKHAFVVKVLQFALQCGGKVIEAFVRYCIVMVVALSSRYYDGNHAGRKRASGYLGHRDINGQLPYM